MRAPTACRRMVSGSLSLPCAGCFPPFPHGTCPLSVSREYLALPDGPGGFTQGFSCPALLRVPPRGVRVRVRGCHPLRPAFPGGSAPLAPALFAALLPRWGVATRRFGLFPGRSPLLGESLLFSLPAGTKMFQFPALAPPHLRRSRPCRAGGCPIRTPAGQRPVAPHRRFSQLPASLHRLLEPRHPPCALIHFLPLREKPGRDSRRLLLGSRRSNFFSCLQSCRKMSKSVCPKQRATWRITDSNR